MLAIGCPDLTRVYGSGTNVTKALDSLELIAVASILAFLALVAALRRRISCTSPYRGQA